MQWTDAAHAGFTTGHPWIEANPNHVSINAADEVADPTSVFHHYRQLIGLRHTDATIAFGDFTMLLPDHPTVYAFLRSDDEHQLLVIANFSAEDSAIDVDDAEAWAGAEVVIRSGGSPTTTSSPLTLGCWEARVLRRPR
jgi:oligo-1,6-glucosidase